MSGHIVYNVKRCLQLKTFKSDFKQVFLYQKVVRRYLGGSGGLDSHSERCTETLVSDEMIPEADPCSHALFSSFLQCSKAVQQNDGLSSHQREMDVL